MGSSKNPQPSQAVARAIGGSPMTDDKTLMLKIAVIILIKHEEVKLVSIESSSLLPSDQYSAFYQRRKVTTNPTLNPASIATPDIHYTVLEGRACILSWYNWPPFHHFQCLLLKADHV